MSSFNVIRVIKSRSMRWAEHIARMGEMRNPYRILVEKSAGKDHSEDLSVEGRTISEWILEK
jgi:hypothetical protein